MYINISDYPQAIAQWVGVSKAIEATVHLALLRVSPTINMLVVLGPSFVITRFVLGKSLSYWERLAARLLVRCGDMA